MKILRIIFLGVTAALLSMGAGAQERSNTLVISSPANGTVVAPGHAITNAEGKSARQATMSPSSSTPKRAYSEEEYNLLRQQYKPNQPQAYGPLPAERLDLLARIFRGNMEDQEMFPVVADVIYGKASAVEERLDTGRLSPNARFFMTYPYNDFQSLLDIAIEAGQRDVIQVLLDHHVNVNMTEVTTPSGGSIPIEGPLTIAARNSEDDVVRLLLKEGVDVNQRTGFPQNNETALAAAVNTQNLSTVYLLLTQGADLTSALGPGGTVPPALILPPTPRPIPLPPRMRALRDLLIAYGAKMPSA